MSLFDIIRYPIDENFRREDLERIPVFILNTWWLQNPIVFRTYYTHGEVPPDIAQYIFSILRIDNLSRHEIDKALALMKRLILEYNE